MACKIVIWRPARARNSRQSLSRLRESARDGAPAPARGEGVWSNIGASLILRMSRVRRTVSPDAALLRVAATDAERKLWAALRARRFLDWKFRRQHSIGQYVADFACIAAQLVIELDGSQHAEAVEYDKRRSAFMAGEGWRVVRFWNVDIMTSFEGAAHRRKRAVVARS